MEGRAAAGPHSRSNERRRRIRHKFAAVVELTQTDSADPVQAELADLGRGGCYLKLAEPFPVGMALEVSITENGQSFRTGATVVSAQRGKGMGLAFTAIDPKELAVLDGWLAASTTRTWLDSSRRRNQRIMVNIPVYVAVKDSSGSVTSEKTKTISVTAHGALLHLKTPVAKGQTLLLRNASTDDALECSVDYLGTTESGRRAVGVSFILPNRTLWQISFPPEDWSPQHPDAKHS